jgi:photosystem II stability/assembly factor-like uncharacterized protein
MTTFGQQNDIQNFINGMKFRCIGPATMSGRITAIEVDVTNNRYFAGTASGGVWMSKGQGVSWTPITEELPTQAIGSIAINPWNKDEIWVGSGEGNPRNSQNSGVGIFRSQDLGKTWKNMGLKESKAIHRIIINPNNPKIITVAALGSSFGPNKERGVFRTTDGGITWKNILYVNETTGCAELVVDPNNPNKMIVGMWEFNRKPWIFKSGGAGSGMYITIDGGDNWQQIKEKDGLPKGELGRIGVAIAPSKSNIVYALIEAKENALYKSTDGGYKWSKQSTDSNKGDRPFYYSDLHVDPINENRLYSSYTLVSKSEDGGKSFQVLMPYAKVHPDHHAFWIHPLNPKILIDGNDGGMNISYDQGETWQYFGNIPVGQFYHINVDNDVPYNVYGGLQDNGSWKGPSAIWQYRGIHNSDWQELYFGDGFDVMPQMSDTRFVYAMSQGGEIGRVDSKTGFTSYIKPIDSTKALRFNWNSPLAQDPFNDCGLYFGSQYVHHSLDCGNSWQIISGDLSTNDTSKQKQVESGGLTPDASAAENHTTILSIAPSPIEKGLLWAGTDDGRLHITRNNGKTWTELTNSIPECPRNAWFPQIEASKIHAGEAFVIVNNYRQNDWKPYLFQTTDYGKTWKNIVKDKGISSYTMSITQDSVAPNLLFLGTDQGLYTSVDYGKTWLHCDKFPNTNVSDMKIQYRDMDLVVGTFGRTIYILDNIEPLRQLATNSKLLDSKIKMFRPTDAYLATIKSVNGERFEGDAIFNGQNKIPNAYSSVWRKPNVKMNAKDTVMKTVEEWNAKVKYNCYILNAKGDTIRTLKSELDTGFNMVYWSLERKGVIDITYDPIKPDIDPIGSKVMPGIYKMVIESEGNKDSTLVTVNTDPYLGISEYELEQKENALLAYDKLSESAAKSFENLKNAQKSIDMVTNQLEFVTDSIKTKINKSSSAMKDSIAQLMKLYLLPKDAKGLNHVINNLAKTLGKAESYIKTNKGALNTNGKIAMELATKETNQVLEKVNNFIEKNWNKYKEEIISYKIPVFKDIEKIKLN